MSFECRALAHVYHIHGSFHEETYERAIELEHAASRWHGYAQLMQANADSLSPAQSRLGADRRLGSSLPLGAPLPSSRSELQVFASMRFRADGPNRPGGEVGALASALSRYGVTLRVVDSTPVGTSITMEVFRVMEGCHAFVAFGTKDYGEETMNPAATDKEVAFWQGVVQRAHSPATRPLVLIRMLPFDEEFDHLPARLLFGTNALALGPWTPGSPMPNELLPAVLKAIDGALVPTSLPV
eukprot:CAMPEP_0172609846 /NCGR_PEP_ID=MMETSP1068-20121228/29753_1 /TAXON_ID=35684 /ORGANISM="Pseudopedinella elastica, Strain CCMP716" /LENGTH=240 /DNA_ID=CAMNT_0013413449 /DNA_START=957 /DNA_END=1679 /DNA_ORIENTATION=+